MKVISQLKNNEYGRPTFFIGLSIDEYYEQIKPLLERMGEHRSHDMFDVEEHLERLKHLKGDKRYVEEQKLWVSEVYGCSDADDLYVVIDKDLKNGFIAERSFPVAGMQMDPWERYPETIVERVEEIKSLPLIDYDKDQCRNRNTPEYFRGCLIGGAIGDALGYAVEFMSYPSIVAKYGKEGITKYDIKEGEMALISDDTQMTLFTANGILVGKTRSIIRGIGADPYCYVHCAYKDWLTTQGYKPKDDFKRSWLLDVPKLHHRRAPGNTCLSALQMDEMGTIEHPLNTSKGCGAVMRIAPFGLYFGDLEREDPQMYWDQSAKIGALTHGHHMSHLACALLSSIIGRIIYDSDEKTVLTDLVSCAIAYMKDNIKGYGHKQEFFSLMEKAVALASNHKSDVENINEIGQGWVAEEALAIAIYCACRHQDNAIQGIISAVNHGGDSDSTGSIAGNILGAWAGVSAFESYWVDNLELKEIIIEIADDLSEDDLEIKLNEDWDKLGTWEAKYAR